MDEIFTIHLTVTTYCQIDGEYFFSIFVAFSENVNFNKNYVLRFHQNLTFNVSVFQIMPRWRDVLWILMASSQNCSQIFGCQILNLILSQRNFAKNQNQNQKFWKHWTEHDLCFGIFLLSVLKTLIFMWKYLGKGV